jgi:replicative DNA helicase
VWTTFAEWRWGLDAVALRAPEQQVPDALFEQPPEAIAAFLRHLWVAHGCTLPRHSDSLVRFESSSERLVRDVQSLLLRLGIVAERRVRRRSSGSRTYRLRITAPAAVDAFVSSVGAVGRPEARELVTAIHGRGLTNGALPAESRAIPAGEPAPAATAVAHAAPADQLVSADVYWDEVASIEPAGEEEVYDLTVEGLHSFVADDVVVHNSIEQDADLVMFIYRDEYYNGEESDQQGLAELHLAKHRNGPTDMVKLSFLRRFAKFADLPAQM